MEIKALKEAIDAQEDVRPQVSTIGERVTELEKSIGLLTADSRTAVIKKVEHYLESDDFQSSIGSTILAKMAMVEA